MMIMMTNDSNNINGRKTGKREGEGGGGGK